MSTKKKPAGKMYFEHILVTPKLAAQWLEKQNSADNDRNRNVRPAKVAAFTRAMKEGRWRATHQGISFDENGNLLDGQHRLLAIVASGISILMIVVYNQPRRNMSVIDRGSTRTTGDTLRILYGMDNATKRGSAARMVLAIKRGAYGGHMVLEDEEVAEELIQNAAHYDWMFEIPLTTKHAGPVLAALAYAYPVNPGRVREFAQLIVEPANVPAGSIIFRAQEIADTGCRTRNLGGSERIVVFRRMLRCLMAYLKGEKLKQVKDSEEGLKFFLALRGDPPPKAEE